MVFNKIDLDNIKSKIPISTELEKKTKLVKKGKDVWCCCPFHNEKTPSCKINDDLGSFYCFGCGAKGDIFTLYTDLYNYSFLDAVKELAQIAGIQINFNKINYTPQQDNLFKILELSTKWFEQNLQLDENICLNYLKSRSLNEEIIKTFRLGYSYNPKSTLYDYLKSHSFQDSEILKSNVIKMDQNNKIRDFFYRRLIFPIINLQNKVVGFGGRVLDNSNPKYINSPESVFFKKRTLLYNLYNAKKISRDKKNLLICEGYMDVISLHQKGIQSVVAPLGTSFTEDQLLLSWRYVDKPTIMFDGDSAGIRASYKAAIMSLPLLVPNKFLQFIKLPHNLDPDSFLNKYPIEDFVKLLKAPKSLVDFIFNESSATIELKNADQKISYDKYLDDLVSTIKDKKIQYFYKNEFKNLFFNKLKQHNKKKHINKAGNPSVLKQKQFFSFIAALINHQSVRKELLYELEKALFLENTNKEIVNLISKSEQNEKNTDELLNILSVSLKNIVVTNVLNKSIYQLFPYSNPKYDPQDALKEVKESIKNLNTRLSNLKKINKSLDTFENDHNSLNWEELQRIGSEIQDKYEEI